MCYFDILLKVLNHFKTQVDAINGISVWFGMLHLENVAVFQKQIFTILFSLSLQK